MTDILTSKDFTEFIPIFEDSLTKQGRSKATIASYRSDVRLFLVFLQERQLTSEDLTAATLLVYRRLLRVELQENSLRRKIISIRQFFACLKTQQLLADNPFERAIIPERDDELHYELDKQQLQRILRKLQARDDVQSVRNLAIIHLLAFEGLKATELTTLHWKDFAAGRLSAVLRIGGRRTRLITLRPPTARRLRNWRQIVRQHYSYKRDEMMFGGFKGYAGTVLMTKLSRHGLKFLLKQLAEQSALSSLSPETLRHHAIRHMLQRGMSVEESMAHLGLKRTGNIRKHLAQLQQ